MQDAQEAGATVVQDEVSAAKLRELKERYGNHISFYGGISSQQFLPFASASKVYDEACRVRDILGNNGGYILAPTNYITADVPVGNMLALVKAAKGESF